MRVRQGSLFALWLSYLVVSALSTARGQEYGPPDRGQPGDEMIQRYLARVADETDGSFLREAKSQEDWEKLRPRYKEEYFHMLGLWPMPDQSPLAATVTGKLEGDGYVVEMLHYQSRPRLYVTANLYRPAKVEKGARLPAVLYVCGHSGQGRNGNKTAFQSHGIWFARHGYVCLVLDTLQLGEIAAVHHGTYREGRWWWHSRGYTPAGVECLNGIRGIDYLLGRPDVDPRRIAVTGISGGGAATFWIAAADERVRVAVPVSGMADLSSYVSNRVINGHCDCMFLYNTFRWPWTRIAALVAPRPLLFTNSDHDAIFPMDANDRVINRLERVYSLYGASDLVDAAVSIGGHAYRKDIRQAAYRFINTHLKDDPRVVADSEVDLATDSGNGQRYPIPLEELRVFPEDSDIPRDELNTTIDRHFVPVARVEPPAEGKFSDWRAALQSELRRVSFGYFPERIPPAKLLPMDAGVGRDPFATNPLPRILPAKSLSADGRQPRLETEPRIAVGVYAAQEFRPGAEVKRLLLVVQNPGLEALTPGYVRQVALQGDEVYLCEPRGVGATRWTQKNPPNYVERSHVLLGRTVDAGRVWEVIAAARYLRALHDGKVPVYVVGEAAAGVLGAYAALWEPEIEGVILSDPPLSHMQDDAPQFLNVLRVCDVPDVLGMLAPRPLTVYGTPSGQLEKVAAIYAAAGSPGKFVVRAE